jgi:hypothetical protein
MKLIAIAIWLAILGSAVQANAQDVPKPQPTARDLYVSCSLQVRDIDIPMDKEGQLHRVDPTICTLNAFAAMGLRSGRTEGGDNSRRFCLPNDAQSQQQTANVMAYAYIDFFETRVTRMEGGPGKPGKEAFLAALIVKWPCN